MAPTAELPHLVLLVMLKAIILAVGLEDVDGLLHARFDFELFDFLCRAPIPFRHVIEVFGCLGKEDLLLHVLGVEIPLRLQFWAIVPTCYAGIVIYEAFGISSIFHSLFVLC